MIGTNNNYSIIEFEVFVMVYTLAVMHQLMGDGLLIIPNIPGIIQTHAYATIMDLSIKYPLPNYEMMAEYGFKILESHNKITSFSKNDLYVLFLQIEANNGYIL